MTGAQSKQCGIFAGCATNSVTLGSYTDLNCEWKGGWGREEEEGLLCLYELNWMIWVTLREQVSVLTCSVFFILVPQWQLHLTTIPTSLSTSLLVSTSGLTPVYALCGNVRSLWLCQAAFSLCLSHLSPHRSPHFSAALAFTGAFCIINLKGFRIYVEGTSTDWKPLHEAHKPLSGCIFVFKCCF